VHRALPAGGVLVERGTEPWPLLRSVATRHEMRVADEVERLRLVSGGLAFGGADPAFDTDVVAFSDLVAGRASPRCVATEAYYPITPTLMLATTDNNPLSDFEAHPDKEGNQLDLGGRDVASWTAPLAESVALIERYLPLLAEELRLLLRLVIPVGYDPERHLSASYQEYIGALYMTLHPNTMTMVEALIHEFQHNKLNAACHHDPILDNAFWPLFSSPVRPDPRPLHGVVLAVHAFQPVALLYERMAADSHPWAANPSWQRRAGQVLEKIHDGAGTVLANAAPTAAGRQLLDEMRRLDGELVAMGRARGWIA
jgi:HEXXH motif-containing protein